nr:hypothetical protein [uncultured Methanospirillum sp.]
MASFTRGKKMAMITLAGRARPTLSGEDISEARVFSPMSQGPFGIRGIETNSSAEFF